MARIETREGTLGRSMTWQRLVTVLILICCLGLPSSAAAQSPYHGSAFPGTGWNTWDIGRANAMIYMPDGVGIEFTLYDPRTGQSLGPPALREAEHFGAHAPDGSYALARYHQSPLSYELEFASRGKNLVAHVRPLGETHYLLVADLFFGLGRTGKIEKEGNRLVITGKNGKFFVSSPAPEKAESSLAGDQRMTWDLTGDRWVAISTQPQQFASLVGCQRFADEARKAYEKVRVRSDGFLADGAQAALDVISWNMVWNPRADAPVTTVAREWPVDSGILWGGYVQGGWDAVFQSVVANLQSPEMAEAGIYGLLADITPGGYVPNLGTGWGTTEDRSQPPLVAYALLKFYKTHGRRAILVQTFPKLMRWHQWWFTARDGNHDGLLEWGTTPVDTETARRFWETMIAAFKIWIPKRFGTASTWTSISQMMGNKQASTFESGVDNHPMWIDAAYNLQTHTMELDDVGLNSFYALDAWALAGIAHILGRNTEEQALRKEFDMMRARINERLWSQDDGMYLNRHWDGHFDKHISPSNFYPLLAGVATPEQATHMVQEYLLNPKKFWGTYVVPGSPRDDPVFVQGERHIDNDLNVMAPLNYLVYEGLKRYGRDEVAAELAAKGASLFLQEWQTKSHIHEVYNVDTGSGDNTMSSQYYAWGALLPLIQVEELIDIETWGDGIRVGSLDEKNTSISNIPILADSYDVVGGPGLQVTRNGKKLLESDGPIVIRNLRWETARVHFNPTVKKEVHVTLYGFREGENVRLISPEKRLLKAAGGRVLIDVGPAAKTVEVLREKPARH